MRLCNRFFAFALIAVTFIVLEFLKFDETVGAILILNHCSVSFLLNEFNFLVDIENVGQGHDWSPNISVNRLRPSSTVERLASSSIRFRAWYGVR